MAGKIIADTLEHSTAGSIATNYIVDGSVKAWTNHSDSVVTSSLNTSSLLNNSTGNNTLSFTSSMNDTNYTYGGHSEHTSVGGYNRVNAPYGDHSYTLSSSCRLLSNAAHTAAVESLSYNYNIVHGDLA